MGKIIFPRQIWTNLFFVGRISSLKKVSGYMFVFKKRKVCDEMNVKKIFPFFVSLLILCNNLAFAASESSVVPNNVKFTDVKSDHWSYEAVSWGVKNKILEGYGDGTFKPDKNVTGSEFLTMLVKAIAPNDVPPPAKEGVSWDKPIEEYAMKRNWNLSATNFEITRSGVALLVANTMGFNCTSDDSIRILLDKGLSNGKYAATVEGYDGKSLLTRAEAITFVRNYSKKNTELKNSPYAAGIGCATSSAYNGVDPKPIDKSASTQSKLSANAPFSTWPTLEELKQKPLVRGIYSISTDKPTDGNVILSATFPKAKSVWVNIRKENESGFTTQFFETQSNVLNAKIALRKGPGQYKLEILDRDLEDKNGQYMGFITDERAFVINNLDSKDWSFLTASEMIQTEHPEIVALANQITQGVTDNVYKTKLIHDWVASNITYDVQGWVTGKYQIKSALDTLHSKIAVCHGYAFLTAALNRAVGIKAKVIDGGAYSTTEQMNTAPANEINHNWVEVFVDGRWMVQDPTWDSGYITVGNRWTTVLTYKYYDPVPSEFAKNHRKIKDHTE